MPEAMFLSIRLLKNLTFWKWRKKRIFSKWASAQKWVLISNYFDQTSLRNYLTLQLAQGLGLSYVPDSRFVDVYVNGSYLGIYLITEKVEVDPSELRFRIWKRRISRATARKC